MLDELDKEFEARSRLSRVTGIAFAIVVGLAVIMIAASLWLGVE